MTKLTAIIFGITVVLTSFSIAEARHNNGLEGLLIGGVGGAAIGHVITGSPEGLIVGSFLGGTIGMLVAAEYDRNHVVVIKERHRHHHYRPDYSHRRHWSHRDDRFYGKKHRHGHQRDRYRGRHLR